MISRVPHINTILRFSSVQSGHMVSLGKLRADIPELASWIILNASSNDITRHRRGDLCIRDGLVSTTRRDRSTHISQFIVLPLRFHRRTLSLPPSITGHQPKNLSPGGQRLTPRRKADRMAVCYRDMLTSSPSSLRHSKRCNHRILPEDQPIIRQSDCICLSTKPDSGTHS